MICTTCGQAVPEGLLACMTCAQRKSLEDLVARQRGPLECWRKGELAIETRRIAGQTHARIFGWGITFCMIQIMPQHRRATPLRADDTAEWTRLCGRCSAAIEKLLPQKVAP